MNKNVNTLVDNLMNIISNQNNSTIKQQFTQVLSNYLNSSASIKNMSDQEYQTLKDNYIKHLLEHDTLPICPSCGIKEVNYDDTDTNFGKSTTICHCPNCDLKISEIYTISDVIFEYEEN